MHPLFTLEIGKECFTANDIIEAVERDLLPGGEPWQIEIGSFLKQWFNTAQEVFAQTSGSTGKPQVIALSKSKMKVSASLTCDYFGLSPNDRALLCLSAGNIAGKMMLVRALERGLHLIAVNPVGCPLSNINEKLKFTAMVPLQVQRCLEANCLDKSEIVLIGGAVVSDKMQADLINQDVACYSSYGMTETMSHVAVKKLNGPSASEWFEGLADISFSLDGRKCLQIEALPFGIEKLLTNDLCELQDKHHFRWLGRFDFVINSGGVKVSPEQLEKLLSPSIPFPFFITGTPDEKLGEKIVILVEASSSEEIPVQQIRQLIKEWPQYQRPKDIYTVPEFVYTASGKTDRNATKAKDRFRIV
jgi:O-succinylbenzoic acid--CoA ligase